MCRKICDMQKIDGNKIKLNMKQKNHVSAICSIRAYKVSSADAVCLLYVVSTEW